MSINSTCRLLSNGYRFEIKPANYITCTPCCKWEDGPSIIAGSLEFRYKQYREEIGRLDAHTSTHCRQCSYIDDNNIKNMRRFSFDFVPDDAEFGDSSFLEIQIDRTCNAACIMCGPHFSTLWQQELRKAGQKTISNNKIDQLKHILSAVDLQKVRRLNFVGGETFLIDHDNRVLPNIKNPELVTVAYATNGSIYPSQERQNLWKNFKRIHIAFSIDGVGDRFEYIRYPLKWQQVNENIKRIRDTMPPNVTFSCTYTVNIFNIYYYDEFDQWFKSMGFEPHMMSYNLAVGLLAPVSVTKSLHKLITEKYSIDHRVPRSVQDTLLDTTKILDYIKEIDLRRGLDWRKVFPEIADCLQ